MNSNFAQDDQGRLLAVLDDANVTLIVKTDGDTVASEIAHPIADLGGQDAVVVAVANTADVNVQNTVNVDVQNWQPDPASGTNQLAIIGKLPNPIAGKIPVDASGNVVPVSQSGSWAVFVNNVTLPLPTNAATETTLALVKTYLAPATTGPTNFTASATTTPTALASNAGRRVLVVAETSNTAAVRIGGASTTTTVGVPLYPGGSREYEIDNSSRLWVCAVTGTQSLNVEVIP